LIDEGYSGSEIYIDGTVLLNINKINIRYLILSFPWFGGIRNAYFNKIIFSYLRVDEHEMISFVKNIKCDYLCVINNQQKLLIDTKFANDTIVSGSIKGNYNVQNSCTDCAYDVMFISEFRGLHGLSDQLSIAQESKIKLLSLLQDYISSNKLNSSVGMMYSRPEKKHKMSSLEEVSFYGKHLPSATIKTVSSYEVAKKSKVIITFSSNLGLELISAGYKVLFILLDKSIDPECSFQYIGGNNYIYTVTKYEEFATKLDFMLKMPDKDWLEYLNNVAPWILSFDKNNESLNRIIELGLKK
jgi:surface carbohydrate biosynthesis protein